MVQCSKFIFQSSTIHAVQSSLLTALLNRTLDSYLGSSTANSIKLFDRNSSQHTVLSLYEAEKAGWEVFPDMAPFTRETESPATGLPATENTWQAMTASTLSTKLLSRSLFSRSTTGRLTGDSRTTKLCARFQTGDSLRGDSKHTCALSQRICKLSGI